MIPADRILKFDEVSDTVIWGTHNPRQIALIDGGVHWEKYRLRIQNHPGQSKTKRTNGSVLNNYRPSCFPICGKKMVSMHVSRLCFGHFRGLNTRWSRGKLLQLCPSCSTNRPPCSSTIEHGVDLCTPSDESFLLNPHQVKPSQPRMLGPLSC